MIADSADLHAKERSQETAGDLYHHAPLRHEYTPEGQAEADRERNREWVRNLITGGLK